MSVSTVESRTGLEEIRVVVIDDHPVVRAGLTAVVADEDDLVVVGAADGAEAGILQIAAGEPDVVVLDVRLGDGMNGIGVCRRLRDEHPDVGVVVLTSYPQDVADVRAAGAHGVVLKRSDTTHLLRAIRRASDGKSYSHPALAGRRTAPQEFELTHAELRVLSPLAQGLSNDDIAERLCLSIHTVKSHVRSICNKLGATNRTEAAVAAIRRGFSSIESDFYQPDDT